MSPHSDQHAVIVLGGHRPHRNALEAIPDSALVVCADSGLDHALALDLQPHVVIGDFDSASPEAVERARIGGATLIPYDPHKDLTDAELALHYVVEHRYCEVTVLWGGGDRIDHVLGVMAALAHPRLSELDSLIAWVGSDRLHILHAPTTFELSQTVGTTISLVPLGSNPSRLTTSGLHWELTDELLDSHTARGVSNVLVKSPARIMVQHGVLAVIVPGVVEPRTSSSSRGDS